MQKINPRKIVKIFGSVVYALFLFVCVVFVVLSISIKKEGDGGINLFGKQARVVLSESMEKCNLTDVSEYEIKDIPVKTLVVIQTVPKDEQKADEWYANLKKGDVLTFRYVYTKQETITHRLIEDPTPKAGGGYILRLSGDNKTANASTLTQTIDTSQGGLNYVIGKVTSTSYAAGVILVALKNPVCMICIVILPALLLMVVEICRLYFSVSQQKNQGLERLTQEQAKEIEGLKQELEILQGKLVSLEQNGTKRIEQKD